MGNFVIYLLLVIRNVARFGTQCTCFMFTCGKETGEVDPRTLFLIKG